ncbi:FAD binding protein type 2 [Fasciola gigantica]|uniref:FAD binding protein type 2 n=1 Tax=Fasciola gigantica TaxID=46835 RepID=A0A504ZC83_FASGI|nr:FAD binding protein type 2 [Fasciola gigantica]
MALKLRSTNDNLDCSEKNYPEWSKLMPDPGLVDPSILFDPNLTITLGKELQKRIGTLPRVEVHAFHLEYQPAEIVRMLRVQPQSYSEIARAIRAARTMKLTVRACGQRTGGDTGIYGTTPTVLIDCTELADSPRIEFVNVTRKGETEETPGLRVLASVSLNELVAFQLVHRIEIAQAVETTSQWGTVVGAITATAPGMVGPAGGAAGGCLSDEVICVRIVDCHGDLITYSSSEELSSALSTLGLLGVVYDVTLRYKPITLTNVTYRFLKWSKVFEADNQVLRDSIANDVFTELIYLPFNSCEIAAEQELINLDNWNPLRDEIILRTGQRVIDPDSGTSDPTSHSTLDPEPRQQVHLLDPVFGPEPKEFVRTPEKTPWLLTSAHHYLRCRFQPHPNVTQFTPWALNSLGKITEPLRQMRFTAECDEALSTFPQVS